MPRPPSKRSYQVQSVERAFAILSCFSLRRPELSLGQISELTALPKPTAFRLLSVLERVRFVERTPDGQRYQVGIRAFELGSVFLAHRSLESIARPVMERLTARHGLTCNLALLDEGQVVYVATTPPAGPMRYTPIIGYRHYVHCSALGKALVAALPEEEVRSILAQHGMPALSSHTITDPEAFLAHLARVRRQGYAMDEQEGALGFCCLAVPIHDHLGRVGAAMSLSGASPQFSRQAIPLLAQSLREGALEISRQLGGATEPRTEGR